MRKFFQVVGIGCLYEIGLLVSLILSLPKLIKKCVLYGKYRSDFHLRLGMGIPAIPQNKPVVWFHGASVGEVRLLEPLLTKMKSEMDDSVFLVTACTEAGVTEATRLFTGSAYVFIFPLDTSFVINRVVKKLSPSLVVLSEGDYWFNFIRSVKNRGGHVVVINGKISETSFKRYLKVKKFTRFFFSHIDLICSQDHEYKKRFVSMGFPEDRIQVTGNIKLNQSTGSQTTAPPIRKEDLGLSDKDLVIVLGSTHPSDEVLLLPVMKELKAVFTDLKIVWVPRHIERAGQLQKSIASYDFSLGLWTAGDSFKNCDVLIVNVIGVLTFLYSIATVAFVGGTFDRNIGGHNLLEPLLCRAPLLFGPCTFSQSSIADLIRNYKAGFQLVEEPQAIFSSFLQLLTDSTLRDDLIIRGDCFLNEQGDPLKITWKYIKEFIPCIKIPENGILDESEVYRGIE